MRTKTPLLGALRSFFRDVQIANARGVSVGALREVRAMRAELARRRGVSRRTFLTTAGATAAAMAVPRFSLAARAPTVVIVGGGIAGLNCALELADAGIRSTVYQASGRIGGRMFSNNSYWAANQVTEWCGELIDTSHTTVRKLAKRFDLGLDNLLGVQPPRSDDIYYFSGRYYPKNQADRDFGAVAGIIAARRGGCRVSHDIRLQHGGGSSAGSHERLRVHRAPDPRRASLTARSAPRRGLCH